MPRISVVVPVLNESRNLPTLVEQIEAAMLPVGHSFEIIVVDDGSTDDTGEILRLLGATRPHLRALRHVRNFGQSAGLATGLAHAQGEWVATLDGDGQNDPADIPRLMEHLAPGVAAVCGVRRRRQDRWSKRVASRVANAFRRWMTGDGIEDAGCALRVMRRSALRELPVFNGTHRFLPTLLRYQGLRVVQIPVSHRPRLQGVSKYGVADRLWRGLRDCLAMRWYRARCLPLERSDAGECSR